MTTNPPIPAGIGGRSCVDDDPVGVEVAVGLGVAVKVAVGIGVKVGGTVGVGGTGVDVTVGTAVKVQVADGSTALVNVGGVVVGFTGPHDAMRTVSATPMSTR